MWPVGSAKKAQARNKLSEDRLRTFFSWSGTIDATLDSAALGARRPSGAGPAAAASATIITLAPTYLCTSMSVELQNPNYPGRSPLCENDTVLGVRIKLYTVVVFSASIAPLWGCFGWLKVLRFLVITFSCQSTPLFVTFGQPGLISVRLLV